MRCREEVEHLGNLENEIHNKEDAHPMEVVKDQEARDHNEPNVGKSDDEENL